MNARRIAAHTLANTLHAAAAIGAATATYQAVAVPHLPPMLTALAVLVVVAGILDRPFAWAIAKLTAPTGPARTGAEFADRHGNDSTYYSAADFETAYNLAEIDTQLAWTALTTKPATTVTPAA
ncbi:hypothetical protein ABZX39_33575 [Streptomyces collinus]|uniref:hypothetical protein n=1 Tax=Streptomyces collinus TaxID=42684 RepID=UPI0033AA2BE2